MRFSMHERCCGRATFEDELLMSGMNMHGTTIIEEISRGAVNQPVFILQTGSEWDLYPLPFG